MRLIVLVLLQLRPHAFPPPTPLGDGRAMQCLRGFGPLVIKGKSGDAGGCIDWYLCAPYYKNCTVK